MPTIEDYSIVLGKIKFDIRILTIWIFVSNIPGFLSELCGLAIPHKVIIILTILGIFIIPGITYYWGYILDKMLAKVYICNQKNLNIAALTLGVPVVVYFIFQLP